MILKLYRFFMGKVKISATGDYVERVINLCTYNGITLWGVRKKNESLSFFVSVKDFKRLRTIVRHKGIKLHIIRKNGVPFIVNRYRYRYGIVAAVVIFFSVLWFLSGFVWNISVTGNESVNEQVIISACREIGITEGVRANKINAWEKRIELQLKVDELSWAAINIEGCQLTIDVTESVKNEKEDSRPCNLIATHDGIIRKIESTSGDTVVTVGEAVTKGDLLVSGVVELKNGNTHFVHSGGSVIAEVVKNFDISVPYRQKIKEPVCKTENLYVLDFFGVKIPLYFGTPQGEYNGKYSQLRLAHNESYLPIFLHKNTYQRVFEKERVLTFEEAYSVAKMELDNRLDGLEIINIVEKSNDNGNALQLSCEVTLLLDITKEEFLLFSTTN